VLYDTMVACWDGKQSKRPTFTALHATIATFVQGSGIKALPLYASQAVQSHPNGSQLDFGWSPRAYAPWGIRVASLTKSRKIYPP